MNEIELVKRLIAKKKWSFLFLANKIGKRSGGVIGNRLSGRSMTVEALVEMLEAMDYELHVKPVPGSGETEAFVIKNVNRKGEERKGVYHPRRDNAEVKVDDHDV